jgi:hypothetical protein
MYKTSRQPLSKKRFLTPLIIAGVVLVVLFIILELFNVTDVFHGKATKTAPTTAGQSTKGEIADEKSQPEDSKGATPAEKGNDTGNVADSDKKNSNTSTELLAPSGTFVSAHKSVPVNAALSSVCNTSSGANCQITFTSGTTIKSLSSQLTDKGGATYWNSWTPDSIGLTSGKWQVKAVATLNGQTKTSTDALELEIQ